TCGAACLSVATCPPTIAIVGTVLAGSRSASGGINSLTSMPIWDRDHRGRRWIASTAIAATAPVIADGRHGRSKAATAILGKPRPRLCVIAATSGSPGEQSTGQQAGGSHANASFRARAWALIAL